MRTRNKQNQWKYTSSANFIKIVVRGRCWPSMGTKCAVTTAGNPAPSNTPFIERWNKTKLLVGPFYKDQITRWQ